MKVAVTGADGFIGRHLMAALDRAGHTPLDPGHATEVDIRDTEWVRVRLADLEPEIVIHLAAVSGPMLHVDQPELVMAVNGLGTLNVLESAARLGRVPVVVATSVSGFTMGSREKPRPASVYGVSKRCAELLVELYREQFELPCVAVRIGSVYGPGRSTPHVLDDMVERAVAGDAVPFAVEGMEPLVHVRDAADLLAALVEAPTWRPSYDLVTTPTPHEELARVVCELGGTGARPTAEVRDTYHWPIPFDSGPLYRDTGRSYQVGITEGVAELLPQASSAAAGRNGHERAELA